MSPRSSSKKGSRSGAPQVLDVYVGLLFVSLAALVTGCVFLALELNAYEWTIP